MDLQTRMIGIAKALNETSGPINARGIAQNYIENPTTSDVLTTGSILNVMTLLGLVKKTAIYKGKSVRHTYQRYGNNLIVCPVVARSYTSKRPK